MSSLVSGLLFTNFIIWSVIEWTEKGRMKNVLTVKKNYISFFLSNKNDIT